MSFDPDEFLTQPQGVQRAEPIPDEAFNPDEFLVQRDEPQPVGDNSGFNPDMFLSEAYGQQQAMPQYRERPQRDEEGGFWSDLWSAVGEQGVKSSYNNMSLGMSLLGDVAGLDDTQQERIQLLNEHLREQSQYRKLYEDDYRKLFDLDFWAQTLSQQAAPMAGGLAASAVTTPVGGTIAASGLFALQGAGGGYLDTYAKGLQEGLSPEAAEEKARYIAVSSGALEGLSGPIMGKVFKAFRAGKAVSKGKKALAMGSEAVQEGGTEFLTGEFQQGLGIGEGASVEDILIASAAGAGSSGIVAGAGHLYGKLGGEDAGLPPDTTPPQGSPITPLNLMPEAALQDQGQPLTEAELAQAVKEDAMRGEMERYAPPIAEESPYVELTAEEQLAEDQAAVREKFPDMPEVYENPDTVRRLMEGEEIQLPTEKEADIEIEQEGAIDDPLTVNELEQKPTEKAEEGAVVIEDPLFKYREKGAELFKNKADPNAAENMTEAVRQNVGEEEAQALKGEYNRLRDEEVQRRVDATKPIEAQQKPVEAVAETEAIPEVKKETKPPVETLIVEKPVEQKVEPTEAQKEQKAKEPIPLEPTETKIGTEEKQDTYTDPDPTSGVSNMKQGTREADTVLEEDADGDFVVPENKVGISRRVMNGIRKRIGLKPLQKGEKVSDAELFAKALSTGKDKSALATARAIIDNPTVADAETQAGILIALGDADVRRQDALDAANKADEAGDAETANKKYAEADKILEEIDDLTQGARIAGSSLGRALRVGALMIDKESYNLSNLRHRYRKAKKEALTEEDKKKLDDYSKKIEQSEKTLEALEKKQAEMEESMEHSDAKKTFTGMRKSSKTDIRKAKKKQLKMEQDELIAEFTGQDKLYDVGGAIYDKSMILGKLVINQIKQAKLALKEKGIDTFESLTLDSVVDKVMDLVGATKMQIYKAFGDYSGQRYTEYAKESARVSRNLKRQAKLESDVHDGMNKIFHDKEKTGKTPPPSEIQALMVKLKELRYEYEQNVKDENKLSRLNNKILLAQEALDQGIAKFKDTKEGVKERADITKAREFLKEINDKIQAKQRIEELKELLKQSPIPPASKRKLSTDPELVSLRKQRDLWKKELETTRRLQKKLDHLKDETTTKKKKKQVSENANSAAIQSLKKDIKKIEDIRKAEAKAEKERLKKLDEPKRKAEKEKKAIDRRINNLNKKKQALLDYLATGRKYKKEAKVTVKTDEEIAIEKEIAEIKEKINESEKLKRLAEKQAELEKGILPKRTPRKKESEAVEAARKEYNDALKKLKAEDKAFTEESAEDKWQAQQDRKIENLDQKFEDLQKGIETASKKRREDRVDVKAALDRYNETKAIIDTKAAIADIESQRKEVRKTGDISHYKIRPPEKKKEVSNELKRERTKLRNLKRDVRSEIQEEQDKHLWRIARWYRNFGGLSRSVMLSGEMGFALRQLIMFANLKHRKEFGKSVSDGFKAFISDAKAQDIDAAQKDSDTYAQWEGFIEFAEMEGSLSQNEEKLADNIAKKAWIIGKPLAAWINMSERNMIVGVNSMKLSLAAKFDEMYTDATTEEKAAYGATINVLTGRGSLGKFRMANKDLSTIFLAPRYKTARFQTVFGQPLWSKQSREHKRVQKEVAKTYAHAVSMAAGLLGLAAAMGLEVGDDPEDSDFLKVKDGDSRYDIFGGHLQPLRFLIRAGMVAAQESDKDPLDEAGRIIRYSFSPYVTLPYAYATGKNVIGQKIDWAEATGRAFAPLFLMEGWDTYENEQSPMKAAANIGVGFTGVGVQSYKKRSGRPERPERADRPERPTR